MPSEMGALRNMNLTGHIPAVLPHLKGKRLNTAMIPLVAGYRYAYTLPVRSAEPQTAMATQYSTVVTVSAK
jgi:hypothetical protein